MTFLEIALDCIKRGWYVFPCNGKRPLTDHGFHDARNDEAAIREWAAKYPAANVGIATGASGLTVLDIDHGIQDAEGLRQFMRRNNLTETYAVRTGRRDGFGVQLYYTGPQVQSIPWELDGCSGDIRSETGYVMAAGSIHPESREPYEVLGGVEIVPAPAAVRALKSRAREKAADDGGPITEARNVTLTSIAGRLRNAGLTRDELEAALLKRNAERCIPPLDEAEVLGIAAHVSAYPVPEPDAIPVIGGSKPEHEPLAPDAWRVLFHSYDETINAPPVSFLIENFLQCEGVTGVTGPVRERKSIIALNMAHALVTGEPLFGYFKVTRKPERVLYLCPEVSLGPFCDRLKRIGLAEYVGKNLFYRTLSKEGTLKLDDPALQQALPGSVVFLDTAIRFLEGDENSSQDVRAFADGIFSLLRGGALSVVLLHHASKGGGSGDYMDLENALRGSGDMGAFLCSCWGTRLQDSDKPYQSPSFLRNLKQRDFESKDFEVSCDENCRMRMIGDPETRAVTLQSRRGNKADKDGMDTAAEALVRANPTMPVRKLKDELAAHGITRGTTWISKRRAELQAKTGEAVFAG